MAEKTGITPDIVTYGKIIGGGLPVGALAAKKEIMNNLAPVGNVYQAGTLSANPLAMVGGLATLRNLTPENYAKIENNTKAVVSLFRRWLDEYNNGQFKETEIVQEASLFWMVNKKNVKRACDIPENLGYKFTPLFEALLERGIYIAPNGYEVGFCSLAHDTEIQKELERRLFN